jgi:dolichol-phosphate mannosyltransferase
MSLFWGTHLHDYNCGLKAYTKDAAKSLELYGGMHRFIPLLAVGKGFEVTEIPVVHEKRKFGKSKYGFSKIFKDVPDMLSILFLTRFAKRPLHFFGFIGGIASGIGTLILLYLFVLHLLGQRIGTRPLLTFGMLLVLAGFQVLFTGFLADLILHINSQNNHSDSEERLKYKTE